MVKNGPSNYLVGSLSAAKKIIDRRDSCLCTANVPAGMKVGSPMGAEKVLGPVLIAHEKGVAVYWPRPRLAPMRLTAGAPAS